jgi:hypothetical protein
MKGKNLRLFYCELWTPLNHHSHSIIFIEQTEEISHGFTYHCKGEHGDMIYTLKLSD